MRPWIATFFMAMAPVCAQAGFFGDEPPAPLCANGATFDAYFSPTDNVAQHVAAAIASAQKTIRVAAYQFTSKPVSEALMRAMRAGKDVKIVLDKKNNKSGYSAAQFLLLMGQPPHLMKSDDDMREAYIIIDDKDVITGNISGTDDADDERKSPVGVLIIHNAPELAKRYQSNWQMLWDASEEMKKEKP